MKRLISTVILFFLGMLYARATHVFGGELLYTHDSGNRYKISLTIYGDCSGSSFSYLAVSTPLIDINDGTSTIKSIILNPEPGTGTEVSPVCHSELKNTSCKGGTLPGVTKYVYSDTISLPGTSANWQFIFTGDMGTKSVAAGRSNAITNVNNVTGKTVLYLVATLNNSTGDNNSPQYTTIPTPFYCINILHQYNQGAIDSDADSLSYALTPALDNGSPVHYITPYTYDHPVSADSFSFNALNGQLIFQPDIVQDALIVTKVFEYRHGIVVGTSMREMTFIVLDNCNAQPPNANIIDINGGFNKGNVITLCKGTGNLSFKINAFDSTGDTILATPNSIPATAKLTVADNNTPNPVLSFSWNTGTLPTGIYNFFVSYKNDHCPISSTQTLAYTIIIVPPYSISSHIIYPTQCVHKAYVQFNISDGPVPRIVTLLQGSKIIATYTDSTGIITDSIGTGKYTVSVTSPNNTCPVSYTFSVPDSGILPDPFTKPISYCRYDTASAIKLDFIDGSTAQWYDANDNKLSSTPVPSTKFPGIYTWYVSEHYKSCDILFDTILVTIYDLPHINILNLKPSVCFGDKIYLEATGGIKYEWKTTNNKIVKDKNENYFTLVFDTATYTVRVTDEHNCVDSANAVYSDVQRCCLFSYPNAFTPNGDGKNERFRVIAYGNMENYELAIFDRWGQRVFVTTDPSTGWDGNFHGQPCEIGTYFYLLRAKCLTGQYEEHKGDITLIR